MGFRWRATWFCGRNGWGGLFFWLHFVNLFDLDKGVKIAPLAVKWKWFYLIFCEILLIKVLLKHSFNSRHRGTRLHPPKLFWELFWVRKRRPYMGWSSAYSILAILRQLQTFFFEGDGSQWWKCPRCTLHNPMKNKRLGGGFRYLLFSSLPGEDEPILTCIFFKGVGSTTNQEMWSLWPWTRCTKSWDPQSLVNT